ncbi:MAG: hypothetical protein M1370_07525 [Bacteroidetes bacterium]|nr:hypothetical protein [Bacteroidota bacterium]MCL5025784.1 hypothetical protein [Chloroflexota bacterium]
MAELHCRAVSLLWATFGLISNNPTLIDAPEFFESKEVIQSLLTDVRAVPRIPFLGELDAYIYINDVPSLPPEIRVTDRAVFAAADFTRLDTEASDRRYSLFGNLGLFFKYAMATLERYHCIYSFHASGVFIPDDNELLIIIGGAGAGKTVLLLEGLSRGYQIFSTEMVHFQFGPDGCRFFKGAMVDNIRIGNLLFDFPAAAERLGLVLPEVGDPWATKIAIDLESVSTPSDILLNPNVTLLFPKIEAGRGAAIINEVRDRRRLVHMLFDNATEKIGGTTLLYEVLPLDTFDTPALMRARLSSMERFVSGEAFPIKRARTILAGPKNSMEGI